MVRHAPRSLAARAATAREKSSTCGVRRAGLCTPSVSRGKSGRGSARTPQQGAALFGVAVVALAASTLYQRFFRDRA